MNYLLLTNSKLTYGLLIMIILFTSPIYATSVLPLSDTIPPVPSINISSLEVDDAFTASIIFSEAVTGLEQDELMIENGTITEFSGSGSNYNLVIQPFTCGIVNLQIPLNVATDDAGNGNLASGVLGVTYMDDDAPEVVLTTENDFVEDVFIVTVTFSEPVQGLEGGDFNVSNGGVVSLTGGDQVYILTINPGAIGAIAIFLPADMASDECGNANLISNFLIVNYELEDLESPNVTINTNDSEVNGCFIVNVAFSETVEDFFLEDILVENATIDNLLGDGDGINYSFEVCPEEEGEVTISIPGAVVTDPAGNANNASELITVEYIALDVTQPTVLLTTPNTNVEGAFEVQVTFSEMVSNLSVDNFTIINGNASDLVGTDMTYTFMVTPIMEGTITITLENNQITDLAGNGNDASNALVVNYTPEDVTAPNPTLSTSSITVNGAFIVNILFNENITGLETADFEIENAEVGILSGSGNNYALTIQPETLGFIGVMLPADKASDAAGNQNLSSNRLLLEYVDDLRPSVSFETGLTNVDDIFQVIVRFSEPVTGLELTDFFISNGFLLELNGTGDEYTLSVDPDIKGDVQISLPSNQSTDAAGNGNKPSDLFSVYYVGDKEDFFDLHVLRRQYKLAVSWALNTDYKTKEFILERSADGIDFKELHERVSETNSSVDVEYQYEDQAPLSGLNYYRIKQIYEDDTFIYSEIESIYFLPIGDEVMVFPSPAQSVVYLNLLPYEGKRCEVILYNSLGQIFLHELYEALPGYPIPINISEYHEGVYGFEFRIKEVDDFSYKFLIMRNL